MEGDSRPQYRRLGLCSPLVQTKLVVRLKQSSRDVSRANQDASHLCFESALAAWI